MRGLVQLAFDFIEALDSKPKQPPAPASQAPKAPKVGAINPVPLPELLAPTAFRHPRARRELLLGDAVVAYAFERARRRSIGFSVGPEGLSVRAPHWATLAAVDAALREKSGWILRKLEESRERQARTEQGRITWADGASLPYLGGTLTLVLDPAHRFTGRGAALVGALCERYRAPVEFRELGVLTARLHGLCHRALELRPETVLRLLESADAFRRPERFERMLLACEADFRGRAGWADRPYPQGDALRSARTAAAAVQARPLVDQGLSGLTLASALRGLRVAAIRGARPAA